ncbi:hypothetical protein D3C72_1391010 [compost metagenome]
MYRYPDSGNGTIFSYTGLSYGSIYLKPDRQYFRCQHHLSMAILSGWSEYLYQHSRRDYAILCGISDSLYRLPLYRNLFGQQPKQYYEHR